MTEIVYTPNPPPTVIHAPGAPGITWKKDGSVLATAGRVSTVDVTGPGVEASIVGTSLVLAFTGGGGGGGGLSNDPAQPLGAAAAGTSAWAARADHVHPLPAAPTAADIGLGNVDNTADANKPVSDAQASAIAAAAAAAQAAAIAASEPAGAASAAVSAHTAAADAHAMSGVTGLSAALAARAPTVHTHDVTDVTGLSATLAALAPLASPALTGTPTAPTPTGGDSSTRLATTAFVASALSGTLPASAVGAANGVAGLDAGGKLNAGTLPDLAITQTFVRATQAEMLALTCQQGDVCVRTDQSKSYILVSGSPSTLGNWQELLTPTGMGGTVTSVDLASTTGLTASGGPVTASGSLQYTLSANLQGWHAIAPSSKADATHSHTASAISDSTATGRSLLTATDAAAARAAIGAGTSSFDGTYSALTGKPTLGTAAATAATDYATAAQGAKADTAYGWGNHASAGYVGTSDSRLTDAREWTAGTVSQADAEAGTSNARYAWTPLRVKQAIVALAGGGGGGGATADVRDIWIFG